MATAHYLSVALAQEIDLPPPAIPGEILSAADLKTDMSAAGLSNLVTVDGLNIFYAAPEQPVAEGLPILLYRQPAAPDNDNEAHAPGSAPPALPPGKAMLIFMQRLAALRVTPWTHMAKDWLQKRLYPGAMQRGRPVFKQLAQQRPNLLNLLDPDHALRISLNAERALPFETRKRLRTRAGSSRRSELKQAHTMPQPTISIASKFLERRLEHRIEHAILDLLAAV